MEYTIEDVKRDLRRIKVNDLDPETEGRLLEMYREWCRDGSATPRDWRKPETRISVGSEKG